MYTLQLQYRPPRPLGIRPPLVLIILCRSLPTQRLDSGAEKAGNTTHPVVFEADTHSNHCDVRRISSCHSCFWGRRVDPGAVRPDFPSGNGMRAGSEFPLVIYVPQCSQQFRPLAPLRPHWNAVKGVNSVGSRTEQKKQRNYSSETSRDNKCTPVVQYGM